MKKLIIISAIILFTATMGMSQSFLFYRVGNYNISGDTSMINLVPAHFVLKNTSSTAINFKLVRVVNDIPASWTTSICCLIGCLPSFVDTVPPSSFPGKYTLSAGAVDTVIIDFLGNTIGYGRVVMRAFPETNPGNFIQDSVRVYLGAHIGISQISSVVKDYELTQNYPNPFNPSTSINFSLPKSAEVNLVVYDIMGREVARLINNTKLTPGTYKYDFNSGDFNLSSGVYFYKLVTSDFSITKKMILTK
ncbi:MAG: T9SS type A sorting domain-containing protein [Ignavibacteriae bacterium]|nr:T9SS type A sorting domain-containing protein [Ignavibacteriota bacterium]